MIRASDLPGKPVSDPATARLPAAGRSDTVRPPARSDESRRAATPYAGRNQGER